MVSIVYTFTMHWELCVVGTERNVNFGREKEVHGKI